MATSTEVVKAALVTRLQKQLAITGKTMAPHSAPTKTSITRISSEKLAKTIPMAVATIMVMRPTSSMRRGSALPRAMFLP